MGIAGQEPAAVGLFAVDRDPMPSQLVVSPPARGVTDSESRHRVYATSPMTTTSSSSLMQRIRTRWWAAEKSAENPPGRTVLGPD